MAGKCKYVLLARGRTLTSNLQLHRCDAVSFAPVFLDAFTKSPAALEALSQLKHVYNGGAPIGRDVVNKLHSHNIRPISIIGTTETGFMVPVADPDEDTTEYQKIRPSYGCVFEHRDGDAYEMVQYRRPEFERWQIVFTVYPHLDRFPLGDLYVEV